MRCPYCQQNIRVQGRFCPKCGQQIFGLPVQQPRPPGTPPGGDASAPPSPAPPTPYRPYPDPQPPPPDLSDSGVDIDIAPEDRPAPPSPTISGGPPGSPHPATPDEVGKTCPYCRFPLKPSEQVVSCPACRLPHHADCWQENRGCTTYGCRGAAAAAGPAGQPAYGRQPSVLSPPPTSGGTVPAFEYLQANELVARANNALILAICGLLCCAPLSIVGMFMGIAVMSDANRVRGRSADARGKAIAAIVIGIAAIALWIVILILQVAGNQYQ